MGTEMFRERGFSEQISGSQTAVARQPDEHLRHSWKLARSRTGTDDGKLDDQIHPALHEIVNQTNVSRGPERISRATGRAH
jgi:hypothetical protein